MRTALSMPRWVNTLGVGRTGAVVNFGTIPAMLEEGWSFVFILVTAAHFSPAMSVTAQSSSLVEGDNYR